jgi:predicted nucleic acid-binding protein
LSRFVLDASVALSWFVDVPVDAYASRTREFMREGHLAVVPQLWLMEFANGLRVAERRQIISHEAIEESAGEAERLRGAGIEVDAATLTIPGILALARLYQLTAYGATYLELAQREGLALATLDKNLRAAAKKAGVSILS